MKRRHAYLCLDPGITTGFALLDDEGEILGTTVWGTAELEDALDLVIRTCFTNGIRLTAVIEKMPPGMYGELATKLERVRQIITKLVTDTYEIPTVHVAPGEWKPSRIARTTPLPWRFNNSPVIIHQKDAIRMGRYVIEKEKA